MGKMSREDLFREIGEIDETYVEEAQRAGRRRRIASWAVKTLAAAASLVLCVGIGYITVLVMQPRGNTGGSMNSAADTDGCVMEAAQEQYSMAEDIKDQEAGGVAAQGDQSQEQLREQLREQRFPQPSQDGSPAEAPAAREEASAVTQGVPGVTEEESAVTEEAVPVPNYGGQAGSSSAGSGGEQGVSETPKESKEEADSIKDMEDAMDEGLQQSGHGAMDLTWEAARTDVVYGRYVDVQAPEGYSFTSAVRSSSALCVTWNKGMEEISFICRQADEDVSDWLADIEKPEEYDLGLYTVPWGDSVPRELLQRVSNAVFRLDQVTLDIVAARTYQVQEAGDVSGSRTRIGILYSDNVLVEITGKGPSAEEIFAMINLENQA